MATNVYIDGFNLYYGAVRGTPYKWLDLDAFCRNLLPRETITTIHHFTARVSGRVDPQAPSRQNIYLRALTTLPAVQVHFGTFLTHKVWMPLVAPTPKGPRKAQVFKTEKKGSISPPASTTGSTSQVPSLSTNLRIALTWLPSFLGVLQTLKT